MKNSEKNALLSLRIVAVFLGVGGIAGAVVAIIAEATALAHVASVRFANVALMGAMTCIFGFSTWTGVELWRRNPRSLIWAQIILIAQIPYVTFSGFAYQFYTSLTTGVGFSNQPEAHINFGLELGSDLMFKLRPDSEGFLFGINLAAIVSLYLLGKARAAMPKKNVEQLSSSAQSGI